MAKDIVVGIVIGATLSSAFSAAFGNAKKTLDTLGASVGDLTGKQKALSAAIQKYAGALAPLTLARSPMPVRMNRSQTADVFRYPRVPHARGDEPPTTIGPAICP
jgi:phosphoglycerol transferase MdoB-like AlkP superfamily enzyme